MNKYKVRIFILCFSLLTYSGCTQASKSQSLPADIQAAMPPSKSSNILAAKDATTTSIFKTINRNAESIKLCYMIGLKNEPKMQGNIKTRFTIEPNGKVSNATLDESNLNDTDTETCILTSISTWKFEPTKSLKGITVVVPFNLSKIK